MADTYQGFGGQIGKTLADSEPSWEPRPAAPRGSPNVIVILCDDLGFSDIGCYGSEISTPNLDALAGSGVRVANFHSTPLCSPSRAALLTGLNHHAVGMGHLAGMDHGFPGYRGEIAKDVATAAEVFRHNGYRTLMVGKWHLSRTFEHSDAGSRDEWPLQRGFDRFYGFMESGMTNLHHPNLLHEDNHAVAIDAYPDGYYFTDDITDRAIEMIQGVKSADQSVPFFLYLAHGAVHAPLMAKREDMDRYRGRYDVGWDVIREERFARQKALGVIPQDTELSPRNSEPWYDSPAWETLSEREQKVFARHMEVYAAMVDNVDQNWGRLRDALAHIGELDNSIVLFTSDNGGSKEGGWKGTTEYYRTVAGMSRRIAGFDFGIIDADFERIDLLGGPRVMGHYPMGWGMVSNTPFRLHKGSTFAGGHHVPFIASWPARILSGGEIRNQYAHLIDVLPALIDMIGMDVPSQRNGQPVKPMTGTSFKSWIETADAPATHAEQYYENIGHRAYYRDGWEAVTLHYPDTPFDDKEWQLFNMERDPTQLRNVAMEHPDAVASLAAAWDRAAWSNQVYPIDDGSGMQRLADPATRQEPRAVTLYPDSPTLERSRASALILGRAFSVRVSFEHRIGRQGILVAHGDQGGGYCVYIDEAGCCVYAHNGYGDMTLATSSVLDEGTREIRLHVEPTEQALWNIGLFADNRQIGAAESIKALGGLAPFEGIDIGIDRRSPVSWDIYQRHGPYPYTGVLRSVTYEPGPLLRGNAAHVADGIRNAHSRTQ